MRANTTDKCDLLVQQYISVCNKALHSNANRFPFKQIIKAAQTAGENEPVEVIITHTNAFEKYIFYLQSNGISYEPHGNCGDCKCVRSWKVSRKYFEDVVQNPDKFIQNPALINWDWLRDV